MNELIKGNLKVKEVGYFYHGKRYYKFECYKQRKNGYWYKTLITPKSGRSIEEMMKEFEERNKERIDEDVSKGKNKIIK